MTIKLCLLLFTGTLLLSECVYRKAEKPEPLSAELSFAQDIRPIFVTHCFHCHSSTATDPDKNDGVLFDDNATLRLYATSLSSNPPYTIMQARLRGIITPSMPFQRPSLSEDLLNKIDAWIEQGAPTE